MSEKVKKAMLMCFALVMLSGCQKPPETEDKRGVAQADGSQKILKDFEWEKENNLTNYEFLEKTEDGYQCKLTIDGKESVIKIDAPVTVTGLDPVSIAQVSSYDERLDETEIARSFFEGAQLQDATGTVHEELKSDADAEVIMDERMESDPSMDMQLQPVTDNGSEFIRNATNIRYTGTAYQQVKQWDRNGGMTMEYETDISEDFTEDMAWERFSKAMESIGITDLKKICGCAYYDQDRKGYYKFTFTRCINGIPLISGELQAQRNELCVTGDAEITQEGIADIQADQILWKIISSKEEQCMNIGQFVELIKRYQEAGVLKCDQSVTFDHVELDYMMDTQDWKTAELIPVWRMYVPYEKVMDQEREGGSIEVVVDALTGKLINQISG